SSESVGLFGEQNLWLRACAREFGVLLRAYCRKLRKELAVSVNERKRLDKSVGESLAGSVESCDGGVAEELTATGPDHGALSEPPPAELRIVKDARAASNDGRVVFPERPGETHGRFKVLVLFLRGAQVTSIERRHQRRLRKVVVENVRFMFPTQSIIQSEFRSDLPGVLRIKMESLVASGVFDIE